MCIVQYVQCSHHGQIRAYCNMARMYMYCKGIQYKRQIPLSCHLEVPVNVNYCINFKPDSHVLHCGQLLPKQVEWFFRDMRNNCRWRQTRMFWVTWLECKWAHSFMQSVAQFFQPEFFPHASFHDQSSIFCSDCYLVVEHDVDKSLL